MDKVNDALDWRPNEKARDAIEDITSAVKDASEEAQGKMEEIAKEIKNQTGDAVKLLSSSSDDSLFPDCIEAFVPFSVRALKRPETPGVRRY